MKKKITCMAIILALLMSYSVSAITTTKKETKEAEDIPMTISADETITLANVVCTPTTDPRVTMSPSTGQNYFRFVPYGTVTIKFVVKYEFRCTGDADFAFVEIWDNKGWKYSPRAESGDDYASGTLSFTRTFKSGDKIKFTVKAHSHDYWGILPIHNWDKCVDWSFTFSDHYEDGPSSVIGEGNFWEVIFDIFKGKDEMKEMCLESKVDGDGLKIRNVGEPGSVLFWKVTQTPNIGTWNFYPSSGDWLRPEDGWQTIDVKFTAPSDCSWGSTYKGDIKIENVYDSSDYLTYNAKVITHKGTPKTKISYNLGNTFEQTPMLTMLMSLLQKILKQ